MPQRSRLQRQPIRQGYSKTVSIHLMDRKGRRKVGWNRIAYVESSRESLLESADVVTKLYHQLFETDAGPNEEFRFVRPAVGIHSDSQGRINGNELPFGGIGFAREIPQAIV